MLKNFKSIFCLFVTAMLIFSLTGCGTNSNIASESTAVPADFSVYFAYGCNQDQSIKNVLDTQNSLMTRDLGTPDNSTETKSVIFSEDDLSDIYKIFVECNMMGKSWHDKTGLSMPATTYILRYKIKGKTYKMIGDIDSISGDTKNHFLCLLREYTDKMLDKNGFSEQIGYYD